MMTEDERARQGMTRDGRAPVARTAPLPSAAAVNQPALAAEMQRQANRKEVFRRQYVQRDLGPDADPAALAAVAAAQQGEHLVYRPAQAALEVESKDAQLQGQAAPVFAHASRPFTPQDQEQAKSLVQEVAAPLALSWLGALLVGTIVHFSFIRPGKK
jgi:hypothetical protein